MYLICLIEPRLTPLPFYFHDWISTLSPTFKRQGGIEWDILGMEIKHCRKKSISFLLVLSDFFTKIKGFV